MPQPNLYDLIGGEGALRKLVDRFYDLMDTAPEAQGLRALHPPDLQRSRDKLFMFLSGWLGGPPLYVERYGHPKLRARHLPFPIGTSERDQWLGCMYRALDEQNLDPALAEYLKNAWADTADFLRSDAQHPHQPE